MFNPIERKHYLLRAYETGQCIPGCLFYPRWWIGGPLITKEYESWQPYYPGEAPITYTDPDKLEFTNRQQKTLALPEKLNSEGRQRLNAQQEAMQTSIQELAENALRG